MSDYLVTDTDLISVANAIRTKGGTSASLDFPADFVSAIAAIPTGGEEPVRHGYWTRPAGWPNYESLHMENSPNDYVVYLTYDTRPNKNGNTQVGLCFGEIPSGVVIKAGKIENGEFVPLQTLTPVARVGVTLESFADDFIAVQVDMNNVNSGRLNFSPTTERFGDSCLEIFGRPKAGTMLGYNVSYIAGIGNFCRSVYLLDYTAPAGYGITSFYGYAESLEYINIGDFTISAAETKDYGNCIRAARNLSGSIVFPAGPDASNMENFAQNCLHVFSIDASAIDTSAVTKFGQAFQYCRCLEALDISGWVIQSGSGTNNMFGGCNALHTLICDDTEISAALDVSPTMLDHDSLVDLISALQTVTNSPTLKLGTTLQAKLSAEEIAAATAKGWTVT